MKFKYLIVDDEPLARKLIASHASKIESLELVGECGNAIEAANLLRTRSVDLIFLDIQMPEMTGFQLASTLKNPPAIILTTAFRDYAPEAFDLNVVDYLLKPISFERLLKSVNKFFDRTIEKGNSVASVIHEDQRFVHIKADRKIHKVIESEIRYIESLDDYVKVHLKDMILITRENISTLEDKLPYPPFVRIHRSFIINSRWVKTISNEGVELDGKELPFGRAFRKSALHQLSVKQLK
jgi:DNA-binding LytR/AlgR family response regulator